MLFRVGWACGFLLLVSSKPLEDEQHPHGNLLDANVEDTTVDDYLYDISTETNFETNTDPAVQDAMGDLVQQLLAEEFEDKKSLAIKKDKEAPSQVPKEVVISSGKVQLKANTTTPNGNRKSKMIGVDNAGIPIIEGFYEPDNPADTKTYRNARIINNQLIENAPPVDWAALSGGDRQGRSFENSVPSTKVHKSVLSPSESALFTVPSTKSEASSNSESHSSSEFEVSEDVPSTEPGIPVTKFQPSNQEAFFTDFTPAQKINQGSTRPRFFGENSPLTELSQSRYIPLMRSEAEPKSPTLPDFYYKSYYSVDSAESYDAPEYVMPTTVRTPSTTRTYRDPFGYSGDNGKSVAQDPYHYISVDDLKQAAGRDSFVNPFIQEHPTDRFKQARQLAVNQDGQNYVIRQHTYTNADGTAFSVPIPFPAGALGYQNQGQSYVQYDPYTNHKDKSKIEGVKDKMEELVAKFKDMTRPVADPLKEAGDKISYNLGIHEKMSSFQSRLSKASHDPKAMAIAGGAAALLGTLGAGLIFTGAAAGRTSKKLKQRSNDGHNVTRRAVEQEMDQQHMMLDQVLAKMDVSQRQFLDQMQKTGFLRSIEGPCGQAILCQSLASDANENQLKLVEKRAALFVQMLDNGEAETLQNTLEQVIIAAKSGDCSSFECWEEADDSLTANHSTGPR